MRFTRPTPGTSLLLWFAVAGPPLTWTGMHVVGIGFNLWQCNEAGRRTAIPVDLWTAILTGVSAGVALAGFATAVLIFLATRDAGGEPPASRIHFLATLAVALGPIFLFIVLMSGLGAIALPTCHQS